MGCSPQGRLPGAHRLAGSCESRPSDDRNSGPSGVTGLLGPQTKLMLLWLHSSSCIPGFSAYTGHVTLLRANFGCPGQLRIHVQYACSNGRGRFTCKARHAMRLQIMVVLREDSMFWYLSNILG